MIKKSCDSNEQNIRNCKIEVPKCGFIEEIEIPRDHCLIFHKCRSCGEIISTPENQCCVICAYSDKKCPMG